MAGGFYQELREVAPGVVIYQRPGAKTPVWQYRIKRPDGDGYAVKSTKTTDPAQAARVAVDAFDKMRERHHRQQPVAGKTFADVAQALLDDLEEEGVKAKNPTKYQSYETAIRLYFKPKLGKLAIDTIERETLDDYYRWRKKQGVRAPSASTLNSENSVLRAIFDKAVRLKAIRERDVPKIRNFSLEDQESRATFEEDDYQKLKSKAWEMFVEARQLAAARWRKRFRLAADQPLYTNKYWINDPEAWQRFSLYCYVVVIAGTGMRPSTARKLKWGHVRPNPITGSGLVFHGSTRKGGKPRAWAIVPTAQAIGRLRTMRTNRRDKNDPQEPVFPFACYKKSFETLCRKAGVLYDVDGKKRTIYSLRHYYITKQIRQGVRLDLIAKNTMTSEAMIAKHYDHNTTLEGFDQLAYSDVGGAVAAQLDAIMRRLKVSSRQTL